jgi:hypothetical protein
MDEGEDARPPSQGEGAEPEGRDLRRTLDLHRRELDRLRRVATATQQQLVAVQHDADEAEELRATVQELRDQLSRERRARGNVEEALTQLRERRSVRLALRLAAGCRPLMRMVGRVRSKMRGNLLRRSGGGHPEVRETGTASRKEPGGGRVVPVVSTGGSPLLTPVERIRRDHALTVATLGTDLGAVPRGWRVIDAPRGLIPPDVDVIVADPSIDRGSFPRMPISVAWVREEDVVGWTERGVLDHVDVVLAETPVAAERIRRASSKAPMGCADANSVGRSLQRALSEWAEATRFAVLVPSTSWKLAERWGDTHFARAIQRYLERAGHPTRVGVRSEFEAEWIDGFDVVVHIRGRVDYATRDGQVNVLWNISHPALLTPELVSTYDVAFVGSDSLASALDGRCPTPVRVLRQATDAELFQPTDGGPEHELLFVGNSRNQRRPIIDDLTPTAWDLAVYGSGWSPDLIDPRYVRGELVPNRQLPAWYSAAHIVLNDHWPDMREHRYLSNRLYDVLAAGGCVISDHVAGMDEEFDGAVITYTDRGDLLRKVDRHLNDPRTRRRRSEVGRAAVLERHTFSHRVDALLDEVLPLVGSPRRVPTRP